MANRLLLSFVVALGAACDRQQGPETPNATNAPVELPPPREMTTLASPAGRFSVDLPLGARPELRRNEGEGFVQYEITARAAGLEYQLTYADLDGISPDKTERFLDGLVEVLASRNSGNVRDQRALTLDGRAARELHLAHDGAHERWRYLVMGQRAYQLGLISPVDDPAAAQHYFESFRPHAKKPRAHADHHAGIALELPSSEWKLDSEGPEEEIHWATVFTRGDDPGPVILIHSEAVARGLDVMEFSFQRRSQDRYLTDGERCSQPIGKNGELCVFIHENGPIPLRMAVGGFYHHLIDDQRYDAYVVHAVYFDRGITIVMQAPTEEFPDVEPEFRQVLRSLHAHPFD